MKINPSMTGTLSKEISNWFLRRFSNSYQDLKAVFTYSYIKTAYFVDIMCTHCSRPIYGWH